MASPPPSSTPVPAALARKAKLAVWLQRHLPAVYRAWTMKGARRWRQNDMPWTPVDKQLSQCRVMLVTTGGLILTEQEPFDLADPRGDSSYRMIPSDADMNRVVISHLFYDTSAARENVDVLFPLRGLRGLEQTGAVGAVAPRHFSFSGSIPEPSELVSDYAPEVAHAAVEDQVDLALLTPA